MSSTASARDAHLQVLPGGRRVSADYAGIRFEVAREDDAPFPVDGVALEEDTWLALSAPADFVPAPEHPVRVMTQVWEAEPERPGSVVVRDGPPLRLLAVVHDLDIEPSWRESWVAAALSSIFAEAATRRLRTLRIPLLATRHGRLAPSRFMRLLRTAVDDAIAREGLDLRAVWLVRENESGPELLQALIEAREPGR